MSGRQSIHPLTEASIELQGPSLMVSQFGCGCELRDGWEATTGKWWLCSYHEGFEDGIERAEAARCACGRPAAETVAGQPCCGDDR
jgi:hypothetical protein